MTSFRPGLRLVHLMAGAGVAVCLVLGPVGTGGARAQGGWNPFSDSFGGDTTTRRPVRPPPGDAARPPLRPMDAAPLPGRPGDPSSPEPRVGGPGSGAAASPLDDGPAGPLPRRDTVEKADLAPLPSASGPDAAALAALAKDVPAPVRSWAYSRLLLRMMEPGEAASSATPDAAVGRAALLYRAGRTSEANEWIGKQIAADADPVQQALALRLALSVGDGERACGLARSIVPSLAALPAAARAEAIGVQGYCAALSGNASGAGLSAQLAREQGGASDLTLAALEAIAGGEPVSLGGPGRAGLLDWRLAEVSGKPVAGSLALDRLEPATLRAVAQSSRAGPIERIGAAEAAARINALDPVDLAEVYRQQSFQAAELASGQAAKVEPALRRALLFKAAEAERTPFKRTRLVRAALDDARRAGIYRVVAASFGAIVEEIRPVPEVGWFAETAIEVLLAAGRFDAARRWASAGETIGGEQRPSGGVGHWNALIEIADPERRPSNSALIAAVEEPALRGRFTAEGLHRLATVLDALDYHVPIRLWGAASRGPQPTQGHLPATGVLSELQGAVKKRDQTAAIALVFKVMGPDGPEGAHMIALGDAIRALKRVGLEAEARAVAFEAMFGLWPRSPNS